MKKLAIIGKGTAGAFAVTHFLRWTDWEIDWYFDNNIKPQSVGEGSTVVLSNSLFQNIGFRHYNLEEIDGTFKTSIYKEGWGESGKIYHHDFPPPSIGYHFNANKLQEYILSKVTDNSRITIKEQNIKNEQIDSDFIFDCSGKPNDYDNFHKSKYIPVNSVHVTQCYWDYPRFNHTLTVARPYGWIFGIPLRNRCSIGYMYNNNINTLEDVKEDVKEVFKRFDLIPSDVTNTFPFNSYYRKENFNGRIAYNGNASFFLEPLEATSISFMDTVQRFAYDVWIDRFSSDHVNKTYNSVIQNIQSMIMLHYFSGSIYKTPFWDMAKNNGEVYLKEQLSKSEDLSKGLHYMIDEKNKCFKDIHTLNNEEFGTWSLHSWIINLDNLGVYPKIQKLLKEVKST